jgi:hypothetical protein
MRDERSERSEVNKAGRTKQDKRSRTNKTGQTKQHERSRTIKAPWLAGLLKATLFKPVNYSAMIGAVKIERSLCRLWKRLRRMAPLRPRDRRDRLPVRRRPDSKECSKTPTCHCLDAIHAMAACARGAGRIRSWLSPCATASGEVTAAMQFQRPIQARLIF